MKKTVTERHFDEIAQSYDYYKNKNSFYYKNLKKFLRGLIPKDKKVFEVGCGTGDLLLSVSPEYGYGMDISSKMITLAKSKHKLQKGLTFSLLWPSNYFDYIFMSDVIEHLENPIDTFNKISKLMDRNTVFINTMANPLWEPILLIAEKLGLKMPEGAHKRISSLGLRIIMAKAGLKIIKHDYKLLMPINIPLLSNITNKYLEKYFKKFAFIEYFVAVKA